MNVKFRQKAGKLSRAEKLRLAANQERISDMVLKGMSQLAISREVGLSRGRICQILKRSEVEWLESTRSNVEQKRAERIAAVKLLMRVCWAAWEDSKLPLKNRSKAVERRLKTAEDEVRKELGGNNKLGRAPKAIKDLRAKLREHCEEAERQSKNKSGKAEPRDAPRMEVVKELRKTSVERRTGDPRFLDQIAWCHEMIAKLEGLIVDPKTNTGGTVVNIFDWGSVRSGPPEPEKDEVQLAIEAKVFADEVLGPVEDVEPNVLLPEELEKAEPAE
jgi:hypothetical protein